MEKLDSLFPVRVECRRDCSQQKVKPDENARLRALILGFKLIHPQTQRKSSIGSIMLSFLKRILPERVRIWESDKANIPVKSSTVRLLRSEVNRHPVKGTGKFHYSKLDFFVDDQDPVWECINGYHTCAVDSQIDFEQAKSMSKSFTINISDMNCRKNYKSLEAASLIHPLEDAHGSAITWRLHDGSFVTECQGLTIRMANLFGIFINEAWYNGENNSLKLR